jgi:hypothetical protein
MHVYNRSQVVSKEMKEENEMIICDRKKNNFKTINIIIIIIIYPINTYNHKKKHSLNSYYNKYTQIQKTQTHTHNIYIYICIYLYTMSF